MSAVEMMEPRMDVGMDPNGCRSLADALVSGAAPEAPTPVQALEILDGLLVRRGVRRGACARARCAAASGRAASQG
jgi:hypothetical protein